LDVYTFRRGFSTLTVHLLPDKGAAIPVVARSSLS
jgi:hypothetical protein